jgi:hypothetical protein
MKFFAFHSILSHSKIFVSLFGIDGEIGRLEIRTGKRRAKADEKMSRFRLPIYMIRYQAPQVLLTFMLPRAQQKYFMEQNHEMILI